MAVSLYPALRGGGGGGGSSDGVRSPLIPRTVQKTFERGTRACVRVVQRRKEDGPQVGICVSGRFWQTERAGATRGKHKEDKGKERDAGKQTFFAKR